MILPFFPSFIAARGGDEGRKKRNLQGRIRNQGLTPQATSCRCFAAGFLLVSTKSNKRTFIHFSLVAAPKLGLNSGESSYRLQTLASTESRRIDESIQPKKNVDVRRDGADASSS